MNRLRYILSVLLFTLIITTSVLSSAPEITGSVSIRMDSQLGFRVKASIDTAAARDEKTTEYGFIATRKALLVQSGLTAEKLTFDCGVQYKKGIAKGFEHDEQVDLFFDKTDTELLFSAYVYGIEPDSFYERMVIRPYAVVEGVTQYGAPVEMSLYEAAMKTSVDQNVFGALSSDNRALVDMIISTVDNQPYTLDRKDFRIVLSTSVNKNIDSTYSVTYNLFNPFTGYVENDISGRVKSEDQDAISSLLLDAGKIVPAYGERVQDNTEGYIVEDLTSAQLFWIAECDSAECEITLSDYDSTLKCRSCVTERVENGKTKVLRVTENTPVYIYDTDFSPDHLERTSVSALEQRDKKLLCYNYVDDRVVFSEYIKAFVSANQHGNCEYIIVFVNGNENSALDEKCLEHTYFDVGFYSDGVLYDSQSIIYGGYPVLPKSPEKDGYSFIGWSDSENGEIVAPETIPVRGEAEYYAVFEITIFKVTFIFDGETYESYDVLPGETVDAPVAVPELEAGAEFLGWSLDDSNKKDLIIQVSDYVITGHTTFYSVIFRNPNDPEFM